ncbi:hypothetical protein BT93_H2534 [Corymbia citriodora subsp. variegata]|nr:hypothetical protein BT93_H2534 [Corymbia citriodora subsp. variegata]
MVTHEKYKYLQVPRKKIKEATPEPQPQQNSHKEKMMGERYGGGGVPSQQGLLLMVVVGVVVLGPYILGEQGQAMFDAVVELLSPASLLIFTVVLLLTIQFISSNRRAQFPPGCPPYGEPDPLERYFGGSPSPIGVALVLVLVLFLLQNKVSLFGGGEDDGGDE